MTNKPVIKVLDAYRPFVRIIQLYNLANFQGNDRSIVTRNLCETIVFTTCLSSMLIVLISAFAVFFEIGMNLSELAHPLSIWLCVFQNCLTYVVLWMKKEEIIHTIEQLQRMIAKCCRRSRNSLAIYEKLEKRLTNIVTILANGSIIICVFVYACAAILPITYAWFGFPQPDQWILPVGFRVPVFNYIPNITVQFYADMTIQACTSAVFYTILVTSAGFYISLCLYVGSMAKDLRETIAEMDIDLTNQYNVDKFEQDFYQEVVFHSEIIGLIESVAKIESTILFYQLLLCAGSIALLMFAIDANDILSMAFLSSMAGLNSVLTPTFVYCLLSDNVTWHLHSIAEHFYYFAWFRLPVKQQKLFVFPIRRAQKQFRMSGHGIVDCSLRVFLSIIKTAGSYFLIIHNFK